MTERRASRWLAGLTAAVMVFAASPMPASASGPPSVPVPADSVSIIGQPAVNLTVPLDGRLRSDGVAASVAGYAFAGKVTAENQTFVAEPGQRLLVLGLSNAPFGSLPPLAGAIVAPGQRLELGYPEFGRDPVFYLASLPSGNGEVAVEVSAGGLTQRFSLTAGHREGVQPSVLYRDATSPDVVDTANLERDLATPDPTDGLPGAQIAVTLKQATLSWFGPGDPPGVPSAPDRAWLLLDVGGQGIQLPGGAPADSYLHYDTGLTADQVRLTLPDGTTVPSRLIPPSEADGSPEVLYGLFKGTYYFEVPASLRSATLTVTPGQLNATVAFSGSPEVTVTPQGAATFPLAFPPPAPPPTRTALPGLTPASPTSAHHSRTPWWAVVLVVVLVGVAIVVLWLRRRSTRHPSAPEPPASPVYAFASSPPFAHQYGGAAPPSATGPPNGPAPASAVPFAPGQPAGLSGVRPYHPAPDPPPVRANTVLAPIPATAPEPPPGAIEIQVLGPVRLVGWPGDPPRKPVLELAAYLALEQGRAISNDRLRAALSTGKDAELAGESIRTYASQLRRALGAEQVPSAGEAGGYLLTGVGTDWARLSALVKQTDDADPSTIAGRLASALALVRCRPFAESDDGFGWAETDGLISTMEVAIIAAAERLARLALDAGDWQLAAWAVDRGLVVAPTTEALLELAMTAAARSADTDKLTRAWREVTRHLSAADEPVSGRLTSTYQRLRTALDSNGH